MYLLQNGSELDRFFSCQCKSMCKSWTAEVGPSPSWLPISVQKGPGISRIRISWRAWFWETLRGRNLGLVRGPRLEKLPLVCGRQSPEILLIGSLCRCGSRLSPPWGRSRSVASSEPLFMLQASMPEPVTCCDPAEPCEGSAFVSASAPWASSCCLLAPLSLAY